MRKIEKKKDKHIPLQKRPFHGINNSKDIPLILNNTKLFQELLGISQEKLGLLFEVAVHLLQQGRFDEAKNGIEMLVKMNPYVPDFWIALGMCDEKFGRYEDALTSFLIAQTLDAERPEPYLEAIDCCLQLQRQKFAKELITQAEKIIKKVPVEERIAFIKDLNERKGFVS